MSPLTVLAILVGVSLLGVVSIILGVRNLGPKVYPTFVCIHPFGAKSQSYSTKPLFVIFAWSGAWISTVGIVTLMVVWTNADWTSSKKGAIPAQVAAKERSNQQAISHLFGLTAIIGGGLAIVGCAGIRSRSGIGYIVPATILAILLSIGLLVASFVHLVYFGSEPIRGPFV